MAVEAVGTRKEEQLSMPRLEIGPLQSGQYTFQIAIEAPIEKVWRALFEDINAWWLPDFHVVSTDSTMAFDPSPGGKGLHEQSGESGLLWYTVQCILTSEFKVYLVGYLAADWGGPSISQLKLSLEKTNESSCVFKVSDAIIGSITEAQLVTIQNGWEKLFNEGLKPFIEAETLSTS